MQEKIYKKGIKIESDTVYKAMNKTYHFYLEDTVISNNKEYFSSEDKCEEEIRRVAFLLKDLKNVVLDFNGATLLFHGRIVPFILDGCQNITLRNFKIDYDRPFYTQASVLECDSKYMKIRIDKGFDYRVVDGYLYVVSDTWEKKVNKNNSLLWLYDRTGIKEYSFILALFGPEIFPDEAILFPIEHLLVEEDGDNLILKGNFPDDWEYNDGNNSLVFTHEIRDKNTITLVGCKDVFIENFILIHGAALAITGMRTENVYIDNFNMYQNYKENHRLVTNNADAIHFYNCSGKFVLKNSYMEGLLDDTVNIHNNYLLVKKSKGKRLILESKAAGIDIHCPFFTSGDYITVYHQRTQESKGNYKILNIEIDEEKQLYFFDLDRESNGIEAGDTIENMSGQPEILLENCVFGRFRGTMRLQSRGKTIVRNCEFRNKETSLLFTGDTTFWYESGPVNDFMVENCRFYHTERGPRLNFWGEVDYTPKENYYHKNITVKDCYFDGGTVAILRHVDDFKFINNKSNSSMCIEAYDSNNVIAENVYVVGGKTDESNDK